MCGSEDPLFTPLPVVCKCPISSKSVSSQDPLLRKFGNFSLNSLDFCPSFSSQAPKIWKFSAHRPPNLEIFSSQAPSFRGKYQFASPHLGNPGSTPIPEKKVECPPHPGVRPAFYWKHGRIGQSFGKYMYEPDNFTKACLPFSVLCSLNSVNFVCFSYHGGMVASVSKDGKKNWGTTLPGARISRQRPVGWLPPKKI